MQVRDYIRCLCHQFILIGCVINLGSSLFGMGSNDLSLEA